MSFSFSPQTIVIQFKEAISEQKALIFPLKSEDLAVAPLLVERERIVDELQIALTNKVCIRTEWQRSPPRTICKAYDKSISDPLYARRLAIDQQIAAYHKTQRIFNDAVQAAKTERDRLIEAVKPFQIEVKVREDQRLSTINQQISIDAERAADKARIIELKELNREASEPQNMIGALSPIQMANINLGEMDKQHLAIAGAAVAVVAVAL